jgi:mono/diheme cytochrome c family protein
MRLALVLLLVACGSADKVRLPPDAEPLPDAEPPPPPIAAPAAPAVEGASADDGKQLFSQHCASCHGEDGKGVTEEAAKLRFPPTDLTTTGYLCRTTDARPFSIPSLTDVETAIERGAHRGKLDALKAVARRSLALHVQSLAPAFANPTSPLYVVPAETPDDPASRARGRTMYLATGCWRCHGVDGSGGDPKAVANIRWNGQPLQKIAGLADEAAYRCGATPEAVYRVVGLGLIGPHATIMPRYQDFAEVFERPRKGLPPEWTKHLVGLVTPEEVTAIQSWLTSQPDQKTVAAMPPSARRARAAAMLWDLVHYVRAL